MEKTYTYLKSFGKLLRRLRGATPLSELVEKVGLSVSYLSGIEAGAPIDEATAGYILKAGLGMNRRDVKRLLLSLRLYDLGLRDNNIRQLVADVILKLAPAEALESLRRVHRSYTDDA